MFETLLGALGIVWKEKIRADRALARQELDLGVLFLRVGSPTLEWARRQISSRRSWPTSRPRRLANSCRSRMPSPTSTMRDSKTGIRPPNGDGGRAAVLTFAGDVYQGMESEQIHRARLHSRSETPQDSLRPLRGAPSARPNSATPPRDGNKAGHESRKRSLPVLGGQYHRGAQRGFEGPPVTCGGQPCFERVFQRRLMEKLEAAVITPCVQGHE